MRYAISYVSSAKQDLSEKEILKILTISRKNNIENKISGILLFSEGNFFQVLEGDEKIIKILFKKIQANENHYNLIKIFEKEIEDKNFEGYDINFITVNTNDPFKKIKRYISEINKLSPEIQNSVRHILNKFTDLTY